MSHIRREQFFWDFIKLGEVPDFYTNIVFNKTNYILENSTTILDTNTQKIICVALFPTHLTSKIKDEDNYYLNKIPQINYNGAGIYINQPKTFDEFLNENLKPRIKKNLKRTISRLDNSFNISYKYYYGNISDETCDFLLNTLKKMLDERFDEKNMINQFLLEWNKNISNLSDLIKQKKSSLFVIYDEEKPISISLNRHFKDNMMISECNSYDLDYSKYGLGHIDLYILLKWCIDNDYAFLDLGLGISEYKKKWCNTYYNFDYHIYYKKKSIIAKLIASYEISKIKAKNLIKQLKIDVYLNALKKILKESNRNPITSISPSYTLEPIKTINNTLTNRYKTININSPECKLLRYPIYNYLYSNGDHIDSIKIYEIIDELKTYIIQSNKETLKLSFN